MHQIKQWCNTRNVTVGVEGDLSSSMAETEEEKMVTVPTR